MITDKDMEKSNACYKAKRLLNDVMVLSKTYGILGGTQSNEYHNLAIAVDVLDKEITEIRAKQG